MPGDNGIFSETIAWKIRDDNTRGDIVGQTVGIKGQINGHMHFIDQLSRLGEIVAE